MRPYLYLWHQPAEKRVVASGIEFRDLLPELEVAGGLVLLRHQFGDAAVDPVSRFDFIPPEGLSRLASDDVYGYGDFCWADFGRTVVLSRLTDQAIAELTFFGHTARPFKEVGISGLNNRFLYWAHDDGWYTRIFYDRWNAVGSVLHRLLTRLTGEEKAVRTLALVRRGDGAFWCCDGNVIECEQTEDIDTLQNKHLTRRSP